jgi:hypothetical protein
MIFIYDKMIYNQNSKLQLHTHTHTHTLCNRFTVPLILIKINLFI